MSLRDEVGKLLNNSIHLCKECGEAEEFYHILLDMKKRLAMPLRVAVVGIMKAGKSTFMNALLGADIVDTGTTETTYTVCWFKYAKEKSLTICFDDGKEENAPFCDLAKWSNRLYKEQNPRIEHVKYIIIYYPSEVLKKIEFIDTPGLNSSYGKDEKNTKDFLALSGDANTRREASNADAIIYAFNRTLNEKDSETLRSFLAEQSVSPINSVGILTKADYLWEVGEAALPIDRAREVSEHIMSDHMIKSMIYSILPVSAKPVEGYAQLTKEDFGVLEKISEKSYDELEALLFSAKDFEQSEKKFLQEIGTKNQRKELMKKLSQYGIYEMVRLIKEGKKEEELKSVLEEKCGIRAVEEMLLNHFGNRTFLLKSNYIFQHLRSYILWVKKSADKQGTVSKSLQNTCAMIELEINRIISSVHVLQELEALQLYYNGQIKFYDEDERKDFLCIMGENGRMPEQRLGMPMGSSVKELEIAARRKHDIWNGRAADFMRDNSYISMASIVARSYEYLYYHLNALVEE